MCIAAVVLLLSAAATNENALTEPVLRGRSDSSFHLKGESLVIQPGAQTAYLRFEGGVTAEGDGVSISADLVEIDIATGSLSEQEITLPSVEGRQERAVADPGSVAREMARELRIPQARFEADALQRLAAAGSVTVRTSDVLLRAGSLVSTDGGRSWTAREGCSLERKDPVSGEEYRLNAERIVYDAANQRALARGSMTALYCNPEGTKLGLEAESCELDMQTNSVKLEEGKVYSYAGFGEAGPADTPQPCADMRLSKLSDAALVFGASELALAYEQGSVDAAGGVHVEDKENGLSITADALTFDLESGTATASGSPRVTYNGGFYEGEEIRILREGEKIVIEVTGEQNARLKLNAPDAQD